jgi:cytochrome d ubiquinol oxidase subunit I
MDPLILKRLQFAITTVCHFFFVPLTLGLSVLVANGDDLRAIRPGGLPAHGKILGQTLRD